MTAFWPASLPDHPLVQGFTVAAQQNVVAFGTEVGPGKVRRRTTARVKNITCGTHLTDAQLADFLTFFEDDLSDGAETFYWHNELGGPTVEFRFSPQNPYQLTALGGGLWQINMNLQQMA